MMETNTIKTLRTVSVTLDPKELADIVRQYLTKEGFEVTNIEFNAGYEMRGYGLNETEVPVFKGCSVACRFITERSAEE